jgi:stage IV sporulation protein B
MQLRRKIAKASAAVLSALLIGLFGTAEYYSGRLPESITAEAGRAIRIAEYPEISCCGYPGGASFGEGSADHVTLSLFGAIPVKYVKVSEAEAPLLLPGGMPFGIKLLMKGVMVTELGDVPSGEENVCPAREAGIEVGDVLCYADGAELASNGELQQIIAESGGRDIELTVNRGGSEFKAVLQPVFSRSAGCWRGGMWVRDSIAGIGTLTFINKDTGEFAGLGHPVCDSDTGELVPVSSGEAVPVEINEIKRGEKGIPGELRGSFIRGGAYGSLESNTGTGIYGRLSPEALDELCGSTGEFPLGYRQDIRTGSAEIYSTVSGTQPERYSIEIESIDYNSSDSAKNMVIRITDRRLLEQTGGIVQGMSGSPIIQDGRLIGAVTHVFVADPARGYAIFAENMLGSSQ